MDSVGHLGDAEIPQPSPGDLCVCFGCGCGLEFGPALELLPLRAAVIAALDPDEADAFRRTQLTVRAFLSDGMIGDHRAVYPVPK